jgi:hypothetical protein
MGRLCSTLEREENCLRGLVGKREGKRPLRRRRRRWESNRKWILEKYYGLVWTGLIWLRIEISGGALLTWQQTFGSLKILGNY